MAEIKQVNDERIRQWSTRQLEFLDAIEAGKSVFLTGSAGTGKSAVIGEVIRTHPEHSSAITASTGIVAVALGGVTAHSFFMIGKGEDSIEKLREDARGKVNSVNGSRLKRTRLLILDEISMISGDVLDKMDAVARVIRDEPNKPMGGLQVIFCGDFFQLPPVKAPTFAFQSKCWAALKPKAIELDQIYRQKDVEFVNINQDLRYGICTPASDARLKRCAFTVLPPINGIIASKLCAARRDVDQENNDQLAKLPGPDVVYLAKDSGPRQDLLKECQARPVTKLKRGAQVILLKNLDTRSGLANGTRGVVIGFTTGDSTTTEASGVTKPPIVKHINTPSQANANNGTDNKTWPIVRFENGQEKTIRLASFEIKTGGIMAACRSQIPLALAWSITIHKSQGMTLERAEVNVSGVFDFGQMYVAISRLRSLEGLRLIGFDSSRLHVNPDVMEFYRGLGMVRKASLSTVSKAPLVSLSNSSASVAIPTSRSLDESKLLLLPVEEKPNKETKAIATFSVESTIDDDINTIIQSHRDKQQQGTKRKQDTDSSEKSETDSPLVKRSKMSN